MKDQELPRLTVKEIRNEAFLFFNLEKGIPFTFISLLKKPFQTIKSYLNFDRRKYVNPLRFVFLSVAFYMIVASFNPSFKSFIDEANIKNKEQLDNVDTGKEGVSVSEIFFKAQETYFSSISIVYIITIPSVAFITFLLFKKQYNYAENLVIHSYMV